MPQEAFIMELKAGALPEYRRRHDEAWPELLDAIRSAGVNTFTIYSAGDRLFVHSEVSDHEAWRRVWATDVHARWGATMAELIAVDDSGTPISSTLDEIFHLDRT